MKKILLLIPLFALLLAAPAACAGHFNMNVKGSGNIGFYFISSDASGTIIQGYSGSGDVEYSSSYSDGVLDTEITVVDGPGRFKTVLKPKNTWTADATYWEDDKPDPNPDDDSGTGIAVFRHSWDSSFNGGGFYRIN